MEAGGAVPPASGCRAETRLDGSVADADVAVCRHVGTGDLGVVEPGGDIHVADATVAAMASGAAVAGRCHGIAGGTAAGTGAGSAIPGGSGGTRHAVSAGGLIGREGTAGGVIGEVVADLTDGDEVGSAGTGTTAGGGIGVPALTVGQPEADATGIAAATAAAGIGQPERRRGVARLRQPSAAASLLSAKHKKLQWLETNIGK